MCHNLHVIHQMLLKKHDLGPSKAYILIYSDKLCIKTVHYFREAHQKTTGGRIWPGPGMSKFGRGRELAVLGFGRGREFHKSMV